jgi:hypothetical protein
MGSLSDSCFGGSRKSEDNEATRRLVAQGLATNRVSILRFKINVLIHVSFVKYLCV